MGGNTSKVQSTMDIVTNVTSNVTSSVSSACGSSNVSNQSISQNVGGNAVMDGVSQSSKSTVNLTCEISNNMQNEFANKLTTDLQSELTAKLSGLGIKNDVETDSKIKAVTNAAANIKLDDIKKCLADSTTTQSITQTAGGNALMRNVSQTAVNEVISKCVMSNDTLNQATNDLDSIIKNKGTAENKGFDPLSAMTAFFESVGLVGSAAVVAPFILSFIVIMLIFLSSISIMK